jgi:antitoxin component YwqK of YwqJK toxin-antitoxin module
MTYQNGSREGNYKKYGQNGTLLEDATYKNNEFNGDAVFYDADGAIASKGKFVNGKKAGMWQFYTKGKLTKEVNMSDPKASYKADSKPKMSN